MPFKTEDYSKWHQFQTNEAAHFDFINFFMDLEHILLEGSRVVVSKKNHHENQVNSIHTMNTKTRH